MAPWTCGIGPRGVSTTRTSQPSRRGSICKTRSRAPAGKYSRALFTTSSRNEQWM